MSLIHTLIAKGTTVLAEHSTSHGAFKQSAQITILSKIPPNDCKLTYVWQDKLIHYVSSEGIVYLVVADDTFKTRFSPEDLESSSVSHLELQDAFEGELEALMHQYSTNPPNDPLKQAQSDLNNVKDIMVQNIDAVLARGERIELLVDKTDSMAGQAHAFRRGARNMRRQMWWKNTRIMMLSGVVCALLLYLFVAQFCGAGLGSCRKKN
ncbi:hypothetical protein QFC21_001982 [Naganishia friedmannii]|uniref:Uncharacterized protein n=1 Tax=Naganishia friedmannii TaxID=89922 RepID=A0ACC2W0U3_9TREE|nr:hypothetical protein QFC21_001982 [Naganishia friedmannii]